MYIISAPNLNLVSSRLQMYFTSLYKLLSDDGPVDVEVDAVCRYGIRGQVMAEKKIIMRVIILVHVWLKTNKLLMNVKKQSACYSMKEILCSSLIFLSKL